MGFIKRGLAMLSSYGFYALPAGVSLLAVRLLLGRGWGNIPLVAAVAMVVAGAVCYVLRMRRA